MLTLLFCLVYTLTTFFFSSIICSEGICELPIAIEFADLHMTDNLVNAVKALKGSAGVYCVKCLVTGAMYVGGSICLGSRLKDHLVDSSNIHLRRAINLYGVSAFTFIVIEFIEVIAGSPRSLTKTLLLSREQVWLNWLFLHPAELIYNFLPNAGSSLGCKLTTYHRTKISGANNGKAVSVTVTDLKGVIVAEFGTVSAASKFLGITHPGVCYAIKTNCVVQSRYFVVKRED